MADRPRVATADATGAFARCAPGLARRLWADLHGYLPSDLLTKADRAPMLASLEVRVPFLNHPLVERAWRLPDALRVRAGVRKYALRRVGEGRLPREVLARSKKGFSIPLDVWLWQPGPFRDMVRDVLLDPADSGAGPVRPGGGRAHVGRARPPPSAPWLPTVDTLRLRAVAAALRGRGADRGMSGAVKVSVIMPVYNAAPYVEEAIESVLGQHFDAFELLVGDDGSTDGTAAVLRRYARHPRVRVLTHPMNRGAAATRNALLREARGRLRHAVRRRRPRCSPGNLRRLSGFLDAHPEIGVVYGDLLVLELGLDDELLGSPSISGADCNRTWDLVENVVNHGGSMSRRELLLRAGGYDEGVYSVDDWSLWLKVAELTRIDYLAGEVYYVWRRHPRSMTRMETRYDRDVARIRRAAAQRRGFE